MKKYTKIIQGFLIGLGFIAGTALAYTTVTIPLGGTNSSSTPSNSALMWYNGTGVTGTSTIITVGKLIATSTGVLGQSLFQNFTFVNATGTGATTTTYYSNFYTGDILTIGTSTASTTIRGSNSTSTFAGGINLTNGCFTVNGGACISAGAGSSAVGGSGAVQFANGTAFNGDNAKFFWDNTAKNLALGTTTAFAKLSLQGIYGEQTPLLDVSTSTNANGSATSTLFRINANGGAIFGSTTPITGTKEPLFLVGTSTNTYINVGRDGHIGILGTNNNASRLSFGEGSNPNVNTNVFGLFQDTSDARFGASVGDSGIFMKSSGGIYGFDYAAGVPKNITLQEFAGTNSNVGIGTSATSPFAKLQILSTIRPQVEYTDSNGGTDLKHMYASTTQGGLAFGLLNDALTTLTEYMRITAAGLGIGTTTPWGKLSVVSNALAPLFVTATSSGARPMFMISATSTGYKDFERVAIGTSTTPNSGIGEVWPLSVSGEIYSTKKFIRCENPRGTDNLTTDSTVSTLCNDFAFDIANAGATTATTDTSSGLPYVNMWAGASASASALAVINAGAGMITYNGAGTGAWTNGSSSPTFEAYVAASSTNSIASSTIFMVGMLSLGYNSGGAEYAPTDATVASTNGYAFIATSTGTWVAVAKDGATASYVQADTLIAATSSLVGNVNPVWQKMRISVSPTSPTTRVAKYFINDQLVATLNVSISAAAGVGQNPLVSVGNRSAGNAKVISLAYIRVWADLIPY